jgi:hypothetical protein
MENLIVFICLTAGIAMLALIAQGTRIILKRVGFRFTAKRLLPWFLWASSVLVVVSVTAFVALDGLSGEARLRVVPAEAGDRTPEAGPEYSLAQKVPYEPEEDEPEEESEEDKNAYGAAGSGPGETQDGTGTNPRAAGNAASEPGHRAYLLAYPDGYFRPNAGISRAETAILFSRLLEESGESAYGSSRFDDVLPGSAYAETLLRMEANGIVTGYPGGFFRPEAHISRAEFVSICLRLAKRREPAETGAGDANERIMRNVRAGHWARAAVEDAARRGWLDACASGGPAFLPDGDITRAEVATIVNRMIGRSADISYIRSHGITGFRDVPVVFWAYPDITEASVDHDFKMSDGKEVWLSVR